MNKKTRLSFWIRTAAVLGCFVGMLGCQSRPLAWFGKESISARQRSLAQTPMALAKQESPRPLPPIVTTGGGSVSAMTAADSGNDPSKPGRVIQVQHTVPVGDPQGLDSFSVPRESMTMIAPPSYGPAMPSGPTVMPPRSQSTHSCPTCNAMQGGNYQPVFPHFRRETTACGVTASYGECVPCPTVESFAVPRQSDPQEYLFDGGDREPIVRVRKDDSLSGLDPEDTVIQYVTEDGKSNVESGCRVAIYAPRFASVRKKTSVIESGIAQRLQATTRPDGPGQFIEQLPSRNVTQPVKSIQRNDVRVVEAVRDRNLTTPAEMVLPMLEISDAFKPYEDLALIKRGDLRSTDPTRLAKAIAAARAWSNVDELQVIVDGQEAIEVSSALNTQELRVYETKGARIRLCKVASEQMANPGDIISFTIRFDNVGEQPLRNLVITDSLTPRLEYVADSQKSSLDADFSSKPNVVGSEILRWELKSGIKPGDGGVIRFDCKVR
ncbi:MAG: DUF11 domain-containing protein [Planctomycetes bacterium]|nr:DUF11 domain-containing protein [Planctomycetota bacterium]